MSQGYEYVYNFGFTKLENFKMVTVFGFEVKEKIEQYGHGKLPFINDEGDK